MALYETDLAHAHADGYAGFFEPAFDWLIALGRAAGPAPVLVDIGCGDGRWMAAARAAGFRVSGVDAAPAFAALARARGLAVEVANAREAEIPRADLVTALGEVLCYRDESGRTALDAVAARAARALNPGGALVFDLLGPETPEGAGWREGADWLVASRAARTPGALTREIVTFRETGGAWRRTRARHELSVEAPDAVARRLEALGFAVDVVDRFGPLKLLEGRVGFVARRVEGEEGR